MLGWLVRQFRYFSVLLRTHDSPRQLAAGFAIGLVVGLVPKGNLLALVLATIMFSLKVNLAVGMITAAVVSFVGAWVDPVTHRLGFFLLSHGGLQTLWTRLANTPLFPWTRFDNTIVLGSLMLGSCACLPAYWLSLPSFTRLRKYLVARAEARRAALAAANRAHADGDAAAVPVSEEMRRIRQIRFREFLSEVDQISQRSRTRRAA